MIETIGWIGGLLLGLSALPQAIECYRTKSAEGLSNTFLFMWLTGEICMLLYVGGRKDWPLIANYVINLMCLAVMLRYKIPRGITHKFGRKQ